MIRSKISWPDTPPVKQYFSIPPSIVYYITKNPSTPKCYSKIIQSCKYFFEENPILGVNRLYYGIQMCSNDVVRCLDNNEKCCIRTDANKIKSKIWITDMVHIFQRDIKNFMSLQYSKLYQPDNAEINLGCRIVFNTFKLLAPVFKKFYFSEVSMRSDDGSTVMLENILESIPKIEKFSYAFKKNTQSITFSTIKNIIKLKNLGNLHSFKLYDIPEVCSIEDLSTFILNFKEISIILFFRHDISEEYKKSLDTLLKDIRKLKIYKCMINYRKI